MQGPGDHKAVRRPSEVPRGEFAEGARDGQAFPRTNATQCAGQHAPADFGGPDFRRHLKQQSDRIAREKERPVFSQVEQHEGVQARASVLEDHLEGAGGAESLRGKRNGRRPSELVDLETEYARCRREDRGAVDDPGRNPRGRRPQPEVHVGRRGHRIAPDQERDPLARRGGQDCVTVLDFGAAEDSDLLPDEPFDRLE